MASTRENLRASVPLQSLQQEIFSSKSLSPEDGVRIHAKQELQPSGNAPSLTHCTHRVTQPKDTPKRTDNGIYSGKNCAICTRKIRSGIGEPF